MSRRSPRSDLKNSPNFQRITNALLTPYQRPSNGVCVPTPHTPQWALEDALVGISGATPGEGILPLRERSIKGDDVMTMPAPTRAPRRGAGRREETVRGQAPLLNYRRPPRCGASHAGHANQRPTGRPFAARADMTTATQTRSYHPHSRRNSHADKSRNPRHARCLRA
jgi:hypothetical protein